MDNKLLRDELQQVEKELKKAQRTIDELREMVKPTWVNMLANALLTFLVIGLGFLVGSMILWAFGA